jgi:GGDEF domain-containing protein
VPSSGIGPYACDLVPYCAKGSALSGTQVTTGPNQQQLRVFLAMSAPLLLARVRQALRMEPGVVIVGEAQSASRTALQAESADPEFILCDERMLSDPEMERLAQSRSRSFAPRFVLMTSNPLLVTYRGAVQISLTLRLDANGSEIRERLVDAQRPPPLEPPEPPMALGERFFVVGKGMSNIAPERGPTTRFHLPTSALEPPPRRDSPGIPLTRQLAPAGRRQQPDEYVTMVNHLAVVVELMEKQRDVVTGLLSAIALDSALRALRDTAYPAAVLVLQLRNATAVGAQRLSLDQSTLQSVGAALRATIRSEDLACKLDATNFATVMPGLGKQHSAIAIQRIREALARLHHNKPGNVRLEAAVGVGYWSPLMSDHEMLEDAWRAMLAEARRLGSGPLRGG